MTIQALKNFGHMGEHIEPGTILDVNPDDFGGTYQSFIDAGLFEEVGTATPAPKPAIAQVTTVFDSQGFPVTRDVPVID